ncbi:hypothetical protein BCR34DRAFT_593198 [Clohesyomyces aquaticus]|uniref:Uncharacterized protein n=1 Tax=Clohesyomyces aquaticus TaxID=1231657 RepID=A0A1Y1YKU5_9PLEO|nr:hypothetical protein BCR34DRAFT_593198 [Clohesyomyces aquaticus]
MSVSVEHSKTSLSTRSNRCSFRLRDFAKIASSNLFQSSSASIFSFDEIGASLMARRTSWQAVCMFALMFSAQSVTTLISRRLKTSMSASSSASNSSFQLTFKVDLGDFPVAYTGILPPLRHFTKVGRWLLKLSHFSDSLDYRMENRVKTLALEVLMNYSVDLLEEIRDLSQHLIVVRRVVSPGSERTKKLS